MMSGQKEPDRATTPAATSTHRLAITSLREHSTALDMFMSRDRKRQIRRRQKRFTASASAAKASISDALGGTPFWSLTPISNRTPSTNARMRMPLALARRTEDARQGTE